VAGAAAEDDPENVWMSVQGAGLRAAAACLPYIRGGYFGWESCDSHCPYCLPAGRAQSRTGSFGMALWSAVSLPTFHLADCLEVNNEFTECVLGGSSLIPPVEFIESMRPRDTNTNIEGSPRKF